LSAATSILLDSVQSIVATQPVIIFIEVNDSSLAEKLKAFAKKKSVTFQHVTTKDLAMEVR
jgi:hypothetical protein